jgi:stringent starvation protein B
MVSTRPYLLRALYEWCVDQGFTPYLAVIVDGRTQVPQQYVKNGQIVLNIGPEAAHQLSMGNEFVTLMARFGGVAQALSVPVDRVAAIYARENGHGMAFEVEEGVLEVGPAEAADHPSDAAPRSAPEPDRPRPRLVRIK